MDQCPLRPFREIIVVTVIMAFIIHSKYFPDPDWLKAHACIIYHNQLLMTKFGRIL